MTAKQRWVVAILGLLRVNLLAMVILAVLSASGASQVVPGYDRPAPTAKHAGAEHR